MQDGVCLSFELFIYNWMINWLIVVVVVCVMLSTFNTNGWRKHSAKNKQKQEYKEDQKLNLNWSDYSLFFVYFCALENVLLRLIVQKHVCLKNILIHLHSIQIKPN